MTKFSIRILHRAQIDVAQILVWIADRSPQGAGRLVVAMERAIARTKQFPYSLTIAPESTACGFEVRQAFFKTRKGRRYRLISGATD